MALSLATAILGSALIGGAASMMGSHDAAQASQDATNAQIEAENQRYAQIRADEQPFVQGGYGALSALKSRLGLPPTASNALTGTPTAGGASGAGYPGYPPSTTYPGAETPYFDPSGGSFNPYTPRAPVGSTPVYTDRAIPLPPGTAAPMAKTGTPGPQVASAVPQTAVPQSNALTGTPLTNPDPGVFGNKEDPTYQAPQNSPLPQAFNYSPFSYSLSDYKASPAYAWQLDQALKGTEATAAATGALQSGAAAKALQDRAEQIALQDFNNERNFAYGNYVNSRDFGYQNYLDTANRNLAAFNTDRAFNQGAYQDARNYLTGQFNTQTGNLFNLLQSGQNAASATGTAGMYATNGIVNALGTNGANQGNAAIAGANAISGLVGNGMNAYMLGNALRPANYAGASSVYPASDLSTVSLGF